MLTFCLALLSAGIAPGVTAIPAPPAPAYHLIKKMPVGGEGGWDYLTVDAAARRLYITHGTHVVVLNVETGAPVGEIANTPGVHGVALAPTLGRGFTSNGRDNTVTIFDLKTLKELQRISVGKNPDAILYDPATRRVFTFNGGSADATAVDAASGSVVGTIPLGGRPEFAVSDERGQVYVNIEDKSEIVAFDSSALTVKNRWSLAPGEGPSGLALDRKHRRLFAVCGNEKMVVLDADSGRVLATPAIGKGPDAAVFDAGSGLAFSSNGADGTLTVMKEGAPGKFTVVETVPTQAGARTMTLDAKTHRIYLVTARVKPTPPGETTSRFRRSYEPGSFEVLVIGR